MTNIKFLGALVSFILPLLITGDLTYSCFKKCFAETRTREVKKWKGIDLYQFLFIGVVYGTSKIIYYTLFKVYIGFSSVIWVAFFFLRRAVRFWGKTASSTQRKSCLDFWYSVYFGGLLSKVSLFVFGLICCFSLWINLFILFAIFADFWQLGSIT